MEIRSIAGLLDYWEKVRGRTQRVVDCIPPDRLEWTWQPGKFTLGDFVRHLGGHRALHVRGKRAAPALALSGPRTRARRRRRGGSRLLRALATRSRWPSSADSPMRTSQEQCVTPAGASITVGKWLRLMVEHEIHHRGQIYMALGMLGVATPPIYGLTSEQVRERSQRS